MITITATIKKIYPTRNWFAPKDNPIAIIKNRYINSSGSLIAARNLTIDKAPTNPKDKASEYFTITITVQVVRHKTKKVLAKYSLLFIDLPYLIYKNLIISEPMADENKDITK